MAEGQEITLRLTVPDPVAGVVYSLQDKAGAPVDATTAGTAPLSFDVPVRVADGPRFLGPFVRSEGPQRRFVYILIQGPGYIRRAKVDIHDIPAQLLAQALAGRLLEATLPGRDRHGLPACATLRPLGGWALA